MRVKVLVAGAVGVMGVAVVSGVAADADDLGRNGAVWYVGESVTLQGASSGHTTAEATATCPTDWESVSGGASVSAGKTRALAWSSKPQLNSWFGRGWQTSASDTTFRVFGVCMLGEQITTQSLPLNEIPAGPRQVELTAECAEGSAVGGSGRPFGDSRDWRLHRSRPVDTAADADTVPDDGWRTSYHYTGDSETSLLVDAVCMGGTPPSYHKNTVTVRAKRSKTFQQACPSNLRVVGGGAHIAGASSASRISATRPFDSKDAGAVPDDGWRVTYTNTSSQALRATVHAMCVGARA